MLYTITIITSSLSYNENIVVAAAIKFNVSNAALIVLKEQKCFTDALNNRIKKICQVFEANSSIDDVIKVFRINLASTFAIFTRNLKYHDNAKIDDIIDEIKKIIFVSIDDVDVLYKNPNALKKLDTIQNESISKDNKEVKEDDANSTLKMLEMIEDEPENVDLVDDDEDILQSAKNESLMAMNELDVIEDVFSDDQKDNKDTEKK